MCVIWNKSPREEQIVKCSEVALWDEILLLLRTFHSIIHISTRNYGFILFRASTASIYGWLAPDQGRIQFCFCAWVTTMISNSIGIYILDYVFLQSSSWRNPLCVRWRKWSNKALMSDSIIDQYSYQINFNNLVLFSQIFAMIMNRSKQLLQLLKEA